MIIHTNLYHNFYHNFIMLENKVSQKTKQANILMAKRKPFQVYTLLN